MPISPKLEVILSIGAYSACSATLVLVNKLILSKIPFPSIVITSQLLASVFIIWVAAALNILKVDAVEWKNVVPYLNYTILFSVGVYCNMKTLNEANLETVIVFKALAPCIVSALDYMFLDREIPSKQSIGALGLIVLGAYGYAITDPKYESEGAMGAYLWPTLYTIVISLVMAYGKKILKEVNLKTQSGPVLYTNLLGWPPMLLFAHMGNEFEEITARFQTSSKDDMFPPEHAYLLVILGCIIGTAIGYSSWWCRDKVSATSFTLIGVMNKCFTVFLNLTIWDQHANNTGIASLALCLVGGSLYRQAPLRKNAKLVVSEDEDHSKGGAGVVVEKRQDLEKGAPSQQPPSPSHSDMKLRR